MRDIIKTIIEGVVSQGKLVGSRGHAFRASSSSNASRTDEPGKHSHGVDIGASRNYAHEKAAKEKADERTRDREREIEKRNREAEQRKKEVAKMANEEHIEEAKGTWVQDKPLKVHVAAMEKRDTEDLKGMHSRWSGDHKDKKSDPAHSERLLAVHHVLKKRGVSVPDLPQHRNLGMMRRFTAEEAESAGTKARVKIKNVARPGDPEPTSEKSTLGKTGSIKTKIVEEKPTMSLPNFGLPAGLIAAARQIVEKKHDDNGDGDTKKIKGGKTAVIIDPETDDKINEGEPKKKHTTPKSAGEKKLAALAHPKDKITHKDVLVGRGVVKEEEVEQINELSPETLGKYAVKVASLPPEKVKPSREAGIEKATKKLRRVKEELSVEEIERIEAIAAQLDEAKPTIVSAPIRGANQDYSGVGTKGAVADYTISDSKKVKVKEEVELDEARGRPRKNPLPAGQEPAGDDTHKHPMQQLEKISHAMEGNEPHFEHKDGSKSKIGKHLAKHIVAIHNSMRTTQEKDSFAQKVHANRDSLRSEVSKHF